MDAPLISCIVPVFNGERYLPETLESVLAQTYRRREIILVDDGSTDGTAAVANSYRGRIRYIRQPNAGEAAARNRGLSMAGGEFVAFLDADDVWHPEKLERQIARFRERPELHLCFTQFRNFWVAEAVEEERRYRNGPLSEVQSGWSICTLLAPMRVFSEHGEFIRNGVPMSESMIWFLRAARRGAVIDVLPEILMHRRLHATNASRTNALDSLFPIVKEWRDYQRRRKICKSGGS